MNSKRLKRDHPVLELGPMQIGTPEFTATGANFRVTFPVTIETAGAWPLFTFPVHDRPRFARGGRVRIEHFLVSGRPIVPPGYPDYPFGGSIPGAVVRQLSEMRERRRA